VIELEYVVWAAFGWLVSMIMSLAIVVFVIVKLPADFFLDSHDRAWWIDQHPVIRWTGRLLKNLSGIFLVFVGIFLSLPGIPGQGLLTVLVGLVLIDFPGKRRCERALVSRPRIRRSLSWLRARFHKRPFRLKPRPASRTGISLARDQRRS
jgi:hypothetical protein